jgi:hypothetical protein
LKTVADLSKDLFNELLPVHKLWFSYMKPNVVIFSTERRIDYQIPLIGQEI